MTHKTDAILDRRLRDLEPLDTVRNLQLFIDGQENPAISVIDGDWSFAHGPKPWQSSVGLHGDDGWLYYQDKESGVVLNRIKNWKLPLPVGYLSQKVDTLQAKIKNLFATINR
jgi:hypothetical protein